MSEGWREMIEIRSALGKSADAAGFNASVDFLARRISNDLDREAALGTLFGVLKQRSLVQMLSPPTQTLILHQLRNCPLSAESESRTIILLRGFLKDAQLLEDAAKQSDMNKEAAWCIAIGWMSDPAATQWLLSRLESPDTSVAREAAVSLAILGDSRGVDSLAATLPSLWMEDYASMIAAVALSRLGRSDGIRFLLISAALCLADNQTKRDNFIANVRDAVNRIEVDFLLDDATWWPRYVSRLQGRWNGGGQ